MIDGGGMIMNISSSRLSAMMIISTNTIGMTPMMMPITPPILVPMGKGRA